MKLTKGTSSYQESDRPQLSQCERPPRDWRKPRDATTPAKEPKTAPTRTASVNCRNEPGHASHQSEGIAVSTCDD